MQLVALVAAVAAIVPTAFASLTINTPPNVVQCQPTELSWSGGTPPYYLTVIPAGQVSATPLERFPTQNGTSYTWTVDIEEGTNIDVALKDATGSTVYTSTITIQSSSDSSCVNNGTTTQPSSTGGSSSGSSTGSSGSATVGNTPSASATGATTAGSTGSSTSSAAGSSSTTTSGAGRLGVSATLGVAGLMGLVGAALF